jgi:predicted TIM-barrel fold metal-dependent hydrolase
VLGGILLPNVPPNSDILPLWDPVYEPLWTLCEELDVVINIHSGSGLPDFGDQPAARAIMLIELAWYAHRAVWHLIFGGVLERHPNLRVVLTEQGTSWIPRGLDTLDWFHRRMTLGGAAEAAFFGAVAKDMSMTPTEYFRRNFWVGASFLRPSESVLRYEVGVDRIMWGADYPHSEGSYPYTTEALRAAFADVPPAETKRMVETTPAAVYGFDLAQLTPIGDRVGPTVAAVQQPLDPADYPADSTCNAFDHEQVVKAW